MIINIVIKLYISTVMATIIAFVLNYRRLDRYYRKQGLRAVFNEDSFILFNFVFHSDYKYYIWNVILERFKVFRRRNEGIFERK